MSHQRDELVSELNTVLDSLAPTECRNMVRTMSQADIVRLIAAIGKAVVEGVKADRESHDPAGGEA